MLRCVAFDLDGVIISSEPSFAMFEQDYGITREQFRDFFAGDPYLQAILGRCDLITVLEPRLLEWDWSAGVEEFIQIWLQSCNTPHPDAARVVRELAALGMTCCATTNQDETRAAYLDALPSLQELFPRRFFSCHLEAAKPDSGYFDAVQSSLGHPPESILFLDDKPANVEGARAAGWQAAHVSSPHELRAVVARHVEGIAA